MHPLLDLGDHEVGLYGLHPGVAAEVPLPVLPRDQEVVFSKDRLQSRLALEGVTPTFTLTP